MNTLLERATGFSTACHGRTRFYPERGIGNFACSSCLVTAAMAKYWTTDLQFKVVDECLQLLEPVQRKTTILNLK